MHSTLSNCLSLYFYEFQHGIEMYQKIREPVENDFQKVNKFIVEQLQSCELLFLLIETGVVEKDNGKLICDELELGVVRL